MEEMINRLMREHNGYMHDLLDEIHADGLTIAEAFMVYIEATKRVCPKCEYYLNRGDGVLEPIN